MNIMNLIRRICGKLVKDDLDIAIAAMYKGCKTYKDWRRVGRQVREGEKCVGWVDGKAVFRKEQTDDVAERYMRARTRRRPAGDKPSYREWREGNTVRTNRIDRDGAYVNFEYPTE